VADELASLETHLVQLLDKPIGPAPIIAAEQPVRSRADREPPEAGLAGRESSVPNPGDDVPGDQSRGRRSTDFANRSSPNASAMGATVFTDGSAEGNPGPGGFGAIVRIPGLPDRELSGGTNHTTNNKMELTAAIVGVRAALDAGAKQITVKSDSEYLVKGMTRWLSGWLAKGWKTSDGQPVKNRELWEQLDALRTLGTIRWEWIRGHAGHPENERCDSLATAAARKANQGSR
jgi:ribonuclease HI